MGDRPELQEEVDLALDERRYVLDAFASLATISHYAILQVARDATRKDIKRAYFRLVNVVHPDRFFGKRLGTYKPKMEALFTRITIAFETLSAADRRAEYDDTLVDEVVQATTALPVERRVHQQRDAAMEALKQRFLDAKAEKKKLAMKHVE